MAFVYGYDAADRLIAAQEWDGHLEAWALHPDGRRDEEKAWATGPWPVDFGETGSLTKHQRYEYGHATGALTSVVDVGLGVTAATYTVDEAGRVTSLARGGATTVLHWDAWDRLVLANVPAAGVSARYQYDGAGLRRRAEVEVTQVPPTGPPAVTTTTRTWAWGGEDGEEEVAEGGAAVVKVGGLVVAQGGARYGHDGLGSAVRETTAPGVTSEGEYSAWGSRNAPGFTTSVGFTGHRAEDVLGLTYAQQRWYDSTTGRFLSRDSVGAGSYLATPNGLGTN